MKKLYEEAAVQDIADAIREKTGGAETYKIAQMGGAVRGINGGAKPVTYSQVNAVAAAYLADVTYDPGDYSTSQIEQYAGQTTGYRKDQPAGVSVPVADGMMTASDALGGVLRKDVRSGTETLYNLAPSAQGADYVVQRSGIVSGSGHLTPTGALRMIRVGTTLAAGSPFNIRDLGGWTCDGGTIRYGLLFRGGELNGKNYGVKLTDADKDVLCTQLGIRTEIDLRSASEISGVSGSALGSAVVWEHYAVTPYATGVNVDGLGAEYAPVLRSIIRHVCANEPCYIHCLLGADRTGTVCAIIEALLGVSQSDIDKDYEITSFKGEMRRRSDAAYAGFIRYIQTMTGSTWRDKAVNWAARIGITADEINAFRAAMIDGTPETVTPDIATFAVTNTLSGAATDNTAVEATQYQPYTAQITAGDGKAIGSVRVTMGGADITADVWRGEETNLYRRVTLKLSGCSCDNTLQRVIDGQSYGAALTPDADYTLDGAAVRITMGGIDVSNYYSGGKIAIARVTGDIQITASAVESAVATPNILVDSFKAGGVSHAAVGYSNGKRLSTSTGVEKDNTGSCVTGFIPCKAGSVIRIKPFSAPASAGVGATAVVFYNSEKAFATSSYITTAIASQHFAHCTWEQESSGVYKVTFNSDFYATYKYVRFTIPAADGANAYVTYDAEMPSA